MQEFAKKIFVAAGAIGAIILAAYIIRLLLLVLAGILLAILFRGVADWLVRNGRLSGGWAITIVLIAAGLLIFGVAWEFGSKIAGQADELLLKLSQAVASVEQSAQKYPSLHRMFSPSNLSLVQPAESLISEAIWFTAAVVLILFVGAYCSTSPRMYLDGFVRFFPDKERRRVRAIIGETGYALQWWLLGQLVAIAVVGIITAAGLLVLGVPMALPLAVVAGILTFIPYVGAIASAIPAVLIGFTVSTHLALLVALVFLIAHAAEGYVVVPLIQHRFVYLPPALILVNQFLMELLAGVVGVAFATPLLVVVMVLVKRLYFHERLMDEEAA